MPDDRFGDLGRSGGEGTHRTGPVGADAASSEARGGARQSASERFAELDRTRPEEPPPTAAPPPARPGRRYMWLVGVVFTAVVVIAAVNVVRDRDDGALRGLPPGAQIPDFAAPLAIGGPDGDANVKQRAGGSDQLGSRPACEVRLPGALNSCDLSRGPLVLNFFVTQRADCLSTVGALDEARRQYPDVRFAAVVGGLSRAEAERLAREQGWQLPVLVDRDGAVLNLFRVGICPTTMFISSGGKVRGSVLGPLSPAELRRRIEALQPAGTR